MGTLNDLVNLQPSITQRLVEEYEYANATITHIRVDVHGSLSAEIRLIEPPGSYAHDKTIEISVMFTSVERDSAIIDRLWKEVFAEVEIRPVREISAAFAKIRALDAEEGALIRDHIARFKSTVDAVTADILSPPNSGYGSESDAASPLQWPCRPGVSYVSPNAHLSSKDYSPPTTPLPPKK